MAAYTSACHRSRSLSSSSICHVCYTRLLPLRFPRPVIWRGPPGWLHRRYRGRMCDNFFDCMGLDMDKKKIHRFGKEKQERLQCGQIRQHFTRRGNDQEVGRSIDLAPFIQISTGHICLLINTIYGPTPACIVGPSMFIPQNMSGSHAR